MGSMTHLAHDPSDPSPTNHAVTSCTFQIMDKLRSLLAKPFPQEESLYETLCVAGGISIFVFLFLFVFKPFGIHTQESGLFMLCLGFGITTFIASLIYEFIIIKVFGLKGPGSNFTFLKWIFYFLGVMLFISFGNFIFVRIALFDDIQWNLFPYMIRGTFAVGVFPIIFFGALALLRQEKKYQAIAQEITPFESQLFESEQAATQEVCEVPTDRVLFIEAMQNYIQIHFINSEGQPAVHTERATLKSISDQLDGSAIASSLIRCHRSYFVNQKFIDQISGNAQGLTLTLTDSDRTIPVSRSYIPVFRKKDKL
jgi:hypothetical protein